MFTRNHDIVTIMCVYKNDSLESFLKAVDSIINQSKPSDIFIFRDGDVSNELENYLNEINEEKFVQVFKSTQNVGLAKGLNSLIDSALEFGYPYIARMDSDDISRNYRFEKQVTFLESNHSVDVLGGACCEFGASFSLDKKELPTNHEELYNFSITRCPFIHPTVMFRSSVFENGTKYPTDTHYSEDMGLWLYLLKNNYIFANLDDVLLDYYLDERTISRRKGFSKFKSEFLLRLKYMIELKRVSIYNVTMIFARFVFHLAPKFIIKLLYKVR
ncbi:glycosyltransferase [Vibrio furnissii]|uniref:glycosyltransferase n=1 Tax=Vibrio furnissii TaxID=29494 RepID=UPI003999F4A0